MCSRTSGPVRSAAVQLRCPSLALLGPRWYRVFRAVLFWSILKYVEIPEIQVVDGHAARIRNRPPYSCPYRSPTNHQPPINHQSTTTTPTTPTTIVVFLFGKNLENTGLTACCDPPNPASPSSPTPSFARARSPFHSRSSGMGMQGIHQHLCGLGYDVWRVLGRRLPRSPRRKHLQFQSDRKPCTGHFRGVEALPLTLRTAPMRIRTWLSEPSSSMSL